ncbi:hypothetical protein [Ornithinibacter aureus]|uniref:hypothetical protein n=2 Tax=Ornithinibacter aureus TaxID=622664 RepID=UPI003CCCF09D
MAQDTWLADYLTSGPALKADGDTLTLGRRHHRDHAVGEVMVPPRVLRVRCAELLPEWAAPPAEAVGWGSHVACPRCPRAR